MAVAQFRRPRHDCNTFLFTLFGLSRAWVVFVLLAASLASLSGSRLTVSERKSNFHPH